MITVKDIERRVSSVKYDRPDPPSELLEKLVADGRSRILRVAETKGLDELSDQYFDFCLKQVGSFCSASYNAVEIALCTGLPPIYVAAFISVHGAEWEHKFFGLKRFNQVDRGPYTVWHSGGRWYNLQECQNRLSPISSETSSGQRSLTLSIRAGDLPAIFVTASHAPHRVMAILSGRKSLLYHDSRGDADKARREVEKVRAKKERIGIAPDLKRSDIGDLDLPFSTAVNKKQMEPDRKPNRNTVIFLKQ